MPESVQSCFELSMHFPVFFFSCELFLVLQFTAGSLYPQLLSIDPWRKTNFTLLSVLAFCLRIVLIYHIEVSKGLNLLT